MLYAVDAIASKRARDASSSGSNNPNPNPNVAGKVELPAMLPLPIPPPLPKTVMLDQEARDLFNSSSKKIRNMDGGRTYAERKYTASAAWKSMLLNQVWKAEAPPAPIPTEPPMQPLFSAGQSVLQWWAPWLSTAETPPKSYNQKRRPKWYVGDCLAFDGVRSVKYGGVTHPSQPVYHVY